MNPHIRHMLVGTFGGLDPVWAGRLLLTLVLAGVVGLERSGHERASGLRTHILVGLGACLITMAGAYGFAELQTPLTNRDPFRLATYVVSGIGFLGAGAILRHGTTVRGLTTAASVWNVAGIGIAVGSGMGTLAIVTVALILFVLVPLKRWEFRLRLGSMPSDLVIHLRDDGKAVGRTLALLSSIGVGVRRATVVPGDGTSVMLRVDLAAALRRQETPAIVKRLLESADITRVDASAAATNGRPDPDDDGDPARKSVVRARADTPREATRRKIKKPSAAVARVTAEEPGPAPPVDEDDEDMGPPARPNRNRPRI